MFKWTLGNPNVSDRVDNLYFTFLFVLRAVMKAGDFLKEVHYNTGDAEADAKTLELINDLVQSPLACKCDGGVSRWICLS